MEPLKPEDLARRMEAGEEVCLLDVREEEEWEACRIEGSVWIPLGELSVRHTELDPDKPTVCICHHGIRSASAAMGLERLDFAEVYNLSGGVDRWARVVDPKMPRY